MEARDVIILTCAGRSTRYKQWGGAKWSLTHPSGNIMAAEALRSMDYSQRQWRVLAAFNSIDLDKYSEDAIDREFGLAGVPVEVINVGIPETRVETIHRVLETADIDDEAAVCIRDCDNALRFDLTRENVVAVGDLAKHNVNPTNRSYVTLGHKDPDRLMEIKEIVERGAPGMFFCAGAYTFRQSRVLRYALEETSYLGTSHVSQLVTWLATRGESFLAREVSSYEDWGTAEDWLRYRSARRTLFLDIDGTLLRSRHRSFKREQGALEKNLEFLRAIRSRVYIVITTSRPEHRRPETIRELQVFNVPFDQLVMGLPVVGRVLVNDGVALRGELSAGAVELRRDADGELEGELARLGLFR